MRIEMVQRPLQAGLWYFLLVFGVGFVLGIPRTVWIEPLVGKTLAVAAEIPLLIAAMIIGSVWIPRRVGLQQTVAAYIGMGVSALFLQQCADIMLASFLMSSDFAAQYAYLLTPAGLIYVAALAAFVFMPVLVWTVRGRKS